MCCRSFFRVFPKRYFLALLAFVIVLLQISMRTVFTMTLVFLNSTIPKGCENGTSDFVATNTTSNCHCVVSEDHKIHWHYIVYSQILSAYFYGYVVTQIPGGMLSQRFPAHIIFGVSCFISFALFLVIPFVLKSSWEAVLAIRVLQGLVEGVSLPAMNGVLANWARTYEKTTLLTIMISGAYLSAAVGLGVTGTMICQLGWKSAFFLFSGAGMFFSLFWLLVIRETPFDDSMLGSIEVRHFMMSKTKKTGTGAQQTATVPWKRIFISLPVSAIFVASFCRCWVFFLLLTEQPQYFRDVFKYDIDKNGALSTLPHICMTVVVLCGGRLADLMISKGVSKTIIRKLFNCGGFGVEAAAMLGLSFIPSSLPRVAVAVLTIGVGCSGFAISGYQVNPHDLAPERASILSGVAKLGSVAGIIMPYMVARLTGSNPGQAEWALVFRISAIIHFAGVVYYAIFASGKIQPWSQAYQQTTINNGDPGTSYGAIEGSDDIPPGPILETGEYDNIREGLLRYTVRFDQPYWFRTVNLGE